MEAPLLVVRVRLEAFWQELRKLGWIEGKNITMEYRFAEQKLERLPELMSDLVRLKVDLIVAQGIPGALAAKNAHHDHPHRDDKRWGTLLVQVWLSSLARPGGNVTGTLGLASELNH